MAETSPQRLYGRCPVLAAWSDCNPYPGVVGRTDRRPGQERAPTRNASFLKIGFIPMPRLQLVDDMVRRLIAVGIRQGAHVGILMDTCPDAVIAIAALSRLGAVAVLLTPDDDLATAVQMCEVAGIITEPAGVGGGRDHRRPSADVGEHPCPESDRVVALGQLNVSDTGLPHWYRPNRGWHWMSPSCSSAPPVGAASSKRSPIIGGRCRPSQRPQPPLSTGVTRSIALHHLHHPSALMVGLGRALAGGSRIALAGGVDPVRFADEIHRYGVTVVVYHGPCCASWWTLPPPELHERHPIRLFIRSRNADPGLWHKVTSRFAPARVLEFYASTEGTRCWPTSPVSRSDQETATGQQQD